LYRREVTAIIRALNILVPQTPHDYPTYYGVDILETVKQNPQMHMTSNSDANKIAVLRRAIDYVKWLREQPALNPVPPTYIGLPPVIRASPPSPIFSAAASPYTAIPLAPTETLDDATVAELAQDPLIAAMLKHSLE
jgi:hypothetical protein